MKFQFFSDPGHGWLKVQKSLIKKLGIQNKISTYSYMRDDNIYLEEDSDLTKFIKSMKEIGKTVEFRKNHTNRTSKIRNYLSYDKNSLIQS